jgi:hypothetical protein
MNPPKTLDEKGRCCGRKPIVYKRPPRLFCCRCDAAFDTVSGKQIPNWAYPLLSAEADASSVLITIPDYSEAARRAYALADAMIAERESAKTEA